MFEIKTIPEIPKNDNPKFSIKLSKTNKELQSSENNSFFISKNIFPKGENIYFAVEICGQEIKSQNIAISINK